MQGGWRRQPSGKALASIKKRGDGIAMPMKWSNSWQQMTLSEFKDKMREEGCSEHMVERESAWYLELLEHEAAYRKELKIRRQGNKEITSEELNPYVEAMERRVDRYAEVTTRNETQLGSGRDRIQYIKGHPDKRVGDSEGDIPDPS